MTMLSDLREASDAIIKRLSYKGTDVSNPDEDERLPLYSAALMQGVIRVLERSEIDFDRAGN